MNEYVKQNQELNNSIPNSIVSIVKANDYNYVEVYRAIENSLELIGGLDKIVKHGDNVFVKINHLPPSSPPERGIITHPVFVKAVVEILKTTGVNITVGDDIGTEPLGQSDPEGIDGFQISGIRQVCQESEVHLSNLREAGFVETSCHGVLLDKVYISRIALEADVRINLPKLKTHAFTTYTGGIKNMFGTIPKGHRLKYHDKYHKIDDFIQMLIDVFSAVKPHLTIMDGIVAMEGLGPASGSLRNLGIILASQDTVALDAVVLKITGLDPSSHLTTKYAQERHLGIGNLQNINIVGEDTSDVAVTDFKYPETRPIEDIFTKNVPSFITSYINNLGIIKPKIVSRLCTGCFECKKNCPANAISIVDNTAFIDQSICITCYCCHEVCRSNAILIRQAVPKRLIRSFINKAGITASRIVRKLHNNPNS